MGNHLFYSAEMNLNIIRKAMWPLYIVWYIGGMSLKMRDDHASSEVITIT